MTLNELCVAHGIEDRALFRPREVRTLLDVSRQTVSRWIRVGKLIAVGVLGRSKWITRQSVAALVEGGV